MKVVLLEVGGDSPVQDSRVAAASSRRRALREEAELQIILLFLQTQTWTLSSVLLERAGSPESVISSGTR